MSLKIPPAGDPHIPIGVQHDAMRSLYWVPVSSALLPSMINGWSEPVRVKIENGEMVFQRVEHVPHDAWLAAQGIDPDTGES